MAASSPAVSYAERARKAQAIRSPIEVVQTRSSIVPITPSTSSSIPQPPAAPALNGDTKTPSPHRPAQENVWDRRREQLAARQSSSSQKSTATAPPQPSASTSPSSSSRENISQSGDTSPAPESNKQLVAGDDDDDDPFVVRTSRARPHIPVAPAGLPAENPEDWPEVGKSLQPPVSTETSKPEVTNGDSTTRKGGAPKWIPLQLQPPAEVQPQSRRDPHAMKSNRQSANSSRAPSNHRGQSRNSRNHSGRNSNNQSANHSRIHSNEGSAHSSPRNPRTRRLPQDDPAPSASNSNGPTTSRSSRTGSPSHINPSSQQVTSSFDSHPSSYGGYLSPPQQGPSPYYAQQQQQSKNLPPVSSPLYHSPSHGPHLSLPPPTDTSLPSMPPPPPAHGYPYTYPNPYLPYDYVPPSAPYPYWNGHHHSHSHPGSGTHSPAYPPSATPSNYAAALPMHVQQHFYPPPPPPPPMQPYSHSHSSSVSAGTRNTTSSVGKVTPGSSPGTSVAMPPPSTSASVDAEPKINGDAQRPTTSTSVIFGSIECPPDTTAMSPPASVVTESDSAKENIEKVFKSLAIGVDSSTTAPPPKPRKPAKPGRGEKEDNKVMNREITVDPALMKEVEAGGAGEVKWKFGNEGLVVAAESDPTVVVMQSAESLDPISGSSVPAVDEELGDDFKVRNFGYGFGTPGGKTMPLDPSKDDVDAPLPTKEKTERGSGETTATNEYAPQPGPSNGRPRGGYYNNGRGYGGYGGGRRMRSGGMNGYGGRGYGRGYGGRGNHNNYNAYQGHRGQPPSFSVTPPLPFQGLPPLPSSHLDVGPSYYAPHPAPRGGRGGLATYIPTGFEAYPPPPLPTPAPPLQPSHSAPQPHSGSSGAGHAGPPMPMPLSQLGFPLDSTRFYLLGQLEYYLSPQNMAQDLFLRLRMDSRGWIDIGLLASFNRVKQLTGDYQLVREVLMLSTFVEVREGYARMAGWERFVLPDAVKSVVESGGAEEQNYASSSFQQQSMNSRLSPGEFGEGEEEEEEDDVVIVMGQNGGEGMWSHEKRT